MLKTLLKLGTTFALLFGGYLGYVRAFDLVLRQFRIERREGDTIFPVHTARSRLEARELARRAFGPDHWTVTDDVPLAYYSSLRGFWMYCREYEEVREQDGVRYDGKRVVMKPFVIISKASDGKGLWTLTAETATLDLNHPIGITNKQNSGGIKVEHALIEGDVRIRDDRGTPQVTADDLKIGPMTYIDYDEARRQITTESHVHIEDPDQTTDGDGLEIRLRVPDPNFARPGAPSSGFGGAEYAILQKNVRVVMRDVGDSGMFAGGPSRPAGKKDGAAVKPEPVPVYVWSKGLMRVDLPPEAPPVAVGPPAPPLPTLVRFEREVVAIHGHLDQDPNQLDCDVLRLTLVPPEPAEGKAGKKPADARTDPKSSKGEGDAVATGEKAAPVASGVVAEPKRGSAFGNLTLQKAHATGYAVWLQLRKQAARVRCVEMIHERSLPYRPDSTFFRGVKSNEVVLEKVDYEPEEPGQEKPAAGGSSAKPARKVKSFTQVRTIAAKLFDRGNGLELVDVRAFGPGRLETRPDVGQPVERIAVWQDELTIVNIAGPDGKTLQQKRVTLTGTRPYFVDLKKKASLDAGREIRVFLKPRSTLTTGAATVATAPAVATTGIGSSLQIEHLLAYRDVHFKAPDRYMEARHELDAPFLEFDPAPVAETAAAPAEAPAEGSAVAAAPKVDQPAKDAPEEPPPGQMMTAVADRIWAKVAIPRGQSLDPSQGRPKKTRSQAVEAAPAKPDPAEGGEADVREALLRGNVAVHQDKLPDPKKKDQAKPKGNDICGEMVYLDNKGKGKLNARVFHRDADDPTPKPGPIRWARVSTDDMLVYGEVLWMDQEHDKVYGIGPGVMNRWTVREMMTDKTPEAGPAAPEAKPAAPPKPRTRAGRPVADKDLLTIRWTKSMEFTGRTKDPTGHPAACADFVGVVDANLTDSRLYCEQRMIVYTDREVPLADLGPAKGGGGREGPDLPEGDENAGREAPAKARADVALIYCYGKPTAITRKVDPDRPIVVEQERIDAWLEKARRPVELLIYNRRTGDFNVPGPGMVFLFDRQDEKEAGRGEPEPGADRRRGSGRSVLPTSTRTASRPAGPSRRTAPAAPAIARKVPPLVLMQVKFTREMIGRVGSGQVDDNRSERWSEFFGNIEFIRTEVADGALRLSGRDWRQEVVSPDERLSEDGFYLTSQSLRIIQQPPPPGSPDKTPARSFAKAYDRVHVNRGEAFAIESDVALFDSMSNQILAYGENGRGVSLTQQGGPGQPPSTSTARAVQFNVKTHAASQVEGSSIIWVDQKTGGRPTAAPRPDPTAPPPPRIKTPFKVPNTNLERRGFTGF